MVTGKAQKDFGDRTFDQFFDVNVFGRPARGSFGNAPKDVFRGPGINSWDISLFKNFKFGGERRILQLRGEGYNAFNHSQWSGVNTTTRFDPKREPGEHLVWNSDCGSPAAPGPVGSPSAVLMRRRGRV